MDTKRENVVSPHLLASDAPCILIYDDDIEILVLCKAVLSKCNYRIETFTQCENVINDAQRLKPHVILMDLWIPAIGGQKAVELLKENPATKNIPAILFSANAEIKEISEKVRADGYLSKPFDINVFKHTIEKMISKSEDNKD